MAPICARNAATRSVGCCRVRRVAARASSRGMSPSTTAPAPIAAIICNHSRRVLLVTLRLTVHPPLEVRCNMSWGESRARVRVLQDQAFVFELDLRWSSHPVLFLLSRALVLTPCDRQGVLLGPPLPRVGPHPLSPSPCGRGGTRRDLRAPGSAALRGGRVSHRGSRCG